MAFMKWVQHQVGALPAESRAEIRKEIQDSASPKFDFFLMVVLSCSIATLGLITDSAAVIIGAMLLAPLMSPLIGIGLASVAADSRLMRNSLSALLRGVLLAVALAFLVTFINSLLPIIPMQELPHEVIMRTRPTPLDMLIALAGGLAAGYAMTQPNISATLPGVAIATALMPPLCTIGIGLALRRWDVAGGSSLLFLTNAVTIAFASALVFFLRGFAVSFRGGGGGLPRNFVLGAVFTALLLIPLTFYSYTFFRETTDNRFVQTVVAGEVARINNAELVEMNLVRDGASLDINITIRTNLPLEYRQVVDLQAAIVRELDRPVSLKINQVLVERLDPLIPPTATHTQTPGPSPTFTTSPTPTEVSTSTLQPTPFPTTTLTPTPQSGDVIPGRLPVLQLYQVPGGPAIGSLRAGQVLTVLYDTRAFEGLVWVQVMDGEGRIGWIPEIYLRLFTPQPSPTSTGSES